jgi:hypothetical protein
MIRRANRRPVLLSRRKTSACHSFGQSSKLLDMARHFDGQRAKVPQGQAALSLPYSLLWTSIESKPIGIS